MDSLTSLIDALEADLPELHGVLRAALDEAEPRTRRGVYLMGTIKSGKSTLANALLGRDLMPRGAGVKTFNLTRAVHTGEAQARVRFRSADQLRAQLAFDLRLLGFDFELPENLFDAQASNLLGELLTTFESRLAADERLTALESEGTLMGLLPLALARVRRVITGIRMLHTDHPSDRVASIAARAELTVQGDRFEDYRDWTRSAEVASLIREIELAVPFPEGLATGLELVDCQGSDSLNPLDFADVEAVAQRADLILYAVQGRLGLRQADRDLLSRLAALGAASRVRLVMNVEAFEPLPAAELAGLEARLAASAQQVLGQPAPVVSLNALHDLCAALGEEEELSLMRRMWERRELGEAFDALCGRENALRADLAELAQRASSSRDDAREMRARLRRMGALVDGLLARDATVVGVEAGGQDESSALEAIDRILDGERARVRAASSRAVDDWFDSRGALGRDLAEFLDQGAQRFLRGHPVAEEWLDRDQPAALIDLALDGFNQQWLHARGSVRAGGVAPLAAEVSTIVARGVRHVRTLLPTAAPGVGMVLDGEDSALADPERSFQRYADTLTAPSLLQPVGLGFAARAALRTEYASRGLISRVRTDDESAGREALERRVQRLWEGSLAAAFRQAADDRVHTLASARENAKFQFFHRVANGVMDQVREELAGGVREHFRRLRVLCEKHPLLLEAPARKRLSDFRSALDALAEQA